jgi:hypothetical protein
MSKGLLSIGVGVQSTRRSWDRDKTKFPVQPSAFHRNAGGYQKSPVASDSAMGVASPAFALSFVGDPEPWSF